MKHLDDAAKKKIRTVIWVALCLVIVFFGWPRKLSRLVPAGQVDHIYIDWQEGSARDWEAKRVTLTGEQVEAFLDYWDDFSLQLTTPKSIFVLPTYHVHFYSESGVFDMLVSAEGVVSLGKVGGKDKCYYAKPWNDQSPDELREFILSLQ